MLRLMFVLLSCSSIFADTILMRGKQSDAVTLSHLAVDVRVEGFLVETTLTCTVSNSADQQLDAEYVLTLPEGAGVDGYRLKIGDQFVDGVVVDKQTARIALERETRRRMDPGLVEWIDGAHYRLRVFPILGHSQRVFQVRYLSTLTRQDDQFSWNLPLRGLDTLKQLSISVDTSDAAFPIYPTGHPFAQGGFGFQSGLGKGQVEDIKPDADLTLAGDSTHNAWVMVEKNRRETRFLLAHRPPQPEAATPLDPRRITLYWDASFSREQANHDRAIELIETLLANWDSAIVDLVVFRDKAEPAQSFPIQRRADLISSLEDMVYDGGTSLVDLSASADLSPDLALLISDGMGNYSGLPRVDAPMMVYNPSPGGNHLRLANLADETGGLFVPLKAEPISVTAQQMLLPYRLQSLEYQNKHITNTRREGSRPDLDFVSGDLHTDRAELRLLHGFAGTTGESTVVTIKTDDAKRGSLIHRFQAIQELRRLSRFPQYHRNDILALAHKHGLVTPHTSLFVLESLHQYVQYEIEPPACIPEIRAAWHEQMETKDLPEMLAEMKRWYADDLAEQWADQLQFLTDPERPVVDRHYPQTTMAMALAEKLGGHFFEYMPKSIPNQYIHYIDPIEELSLDELYKQYVWTETENTPERGEIKLVAIDQFHTPLPKAEFCLISMDDNSQYWLETNESGQAIASGLPEADYLIDILEDGQHIRHSWIEVRADRFNQELLKVWLESARYRPAFDFDADQAKDWGLSRPSAVAVKIVDPNGEPIPGVITSFEDADQNRSAVTNERGLVLSPKSDSESLKVTATFSGFLTRTKEVTIKPGATQQAIIIMDYDTMADALVVVAESPVVDVTTSISGQDITLQLTGSLPTQRSFQDYVQLAANATTDSSEEPQPSTPATMGLKPWAPDAEYLKVLGAVAQEDQLKAYLAQRKIHGQSPAFYFDCAHFWFDQGRREQGFRTLSTILELGWEDPELLKTTARVYMEKGHYAAAIRLFEKITRLRPELPQSFRDLALAHAVLADQLAEADRPDEARQQYFIALELLAQTISEPWGPVEEPLQLVFMEEGRLQELAPILLTEYNAVLQKWQRLGGTGEVPAPELAQVVEFPLEEVPAIVQSVEADLRILLEWNSEEVDADLLVIEPSGELVWYRNKNSNTNAAMTNAYSQICGPESYLLKQAPAGDYQIYVHYWGNMGLTRAGPTTLSVTIFTNYGRPDETRTLKTLRLDQVNQLLDLGAVTITSDSSGS